MKSGVDKARGEVVKVEGTVARWQADATAKRAELVDLEARAGDEVLADETAAVRLTEQMTALRSGIDIADRAAEAAGRKLADVRRALLRARAVEMRDQAASLLQNAEKRQKRTDALLAELADFEGVPFAPAPIRSTMGNPDIMPFTRTQGMREHAAQLNHQALQLDEQAETALPDTLEALVRGLPDAERVAEDASV